MVAIYLVASMSLCMADEIDVHAADKPISFAEFEAKDFDIALTFIGDGYDSKMTLSILHKEGDLIAVKDISHEGYGGMFGLNDVKSLHDEDGLDLILIEGRYGGDGDHTEDRLIVYRFMDRRLEFIADENISNPEYIERNGILQSVNGIYILSLCDVCDGWDASDPEDIFKIPITLTLHDDVFEMSCRLSSEEKKVLLEGFRRQKEADTSEALKYRDREYIKFADDIEADLLCVLD